MRPIRLVLTAFGPYRNGEAIDFEPLRERGLFVISGQTGAGKTTVFDAVCYALYGTASGEDRAEARMLRSHFAGDDTPTSVELVFAARGRKYRVFRQMPHRKAGNKSETGGKAELYELTAEGEAPLTDRFHIKEVDAKLEEIVGLSRDQFIQIVMLPQGEFRKLLTSDTENKEEILRRLFQTGLYRSLEESFARRSRELREAAKDNRQRLLYMSEQVRASLPVREGSRLEELLAQEHAAPSRLMEGLEEEAVYFGSLATGLERERLEAEAAYEAQRTKLAEASRLNARLDELEAAEAMAAKLEGRGGEMAELEAKLERAERAARLAPYEEQSRRAAAEAESVERRRVEASAAAAAAEAEHRAAAEAAEAEEAREPERRKAAMELQKLRELLPAVRTLGERRAELAKQRAEEARLGREAERLASELEQERIQRRAQADVMSALELDAERLPQMQERRAFMQEKYKLLKLMADTERLAAELEREQADHESAAKRLRLDAEELELRWIEGQAGRLAAHLHDGRPCPVCGSAEHPAPASAADGGVSREQLQEAKERLLHVERELSAAAAQAAAARGRGQEAWQQADALGIGHDRLDLQLQEALAEGLGLKAECERLAALQTQRQELREALAARDRRLEELQASKERLLQKLQPLALDIAARSSRLDAELEAVPEPLRDAAALEKMAAELEARCARMDSLLKAARERLAGGSSRLAEARARLDQLAVQAEEAAAAGKDAAERLRLELEAAGFASGAEYLEARLDEELRKQGARVLEAYRTELAAQRRLVAELRKELEGCVRGDAAELAAEADRLKAVREEADNRWRRCRQLAETASSLKAAVGEASLRFEDSERALEEVADLHEMLKGDNALKMSFERYILIEFLEQILYAANERLRVLSSGQFMLERSGRLEARGRQSGLGLDVYDSYTGQNRDVKSLSGGEKFNASLALALGMTDVIQAHRGGVSIEMMFIDEGFGSLDEESLGRAIAALADLQRAGRMIGVISHVQELKDAFPAVLEVSKTKEGHSRTRLVLK